MAEMKKFRAGTITATVWTNLSKNGTCEFNSISIQRSYRDNENHWKNTSNLRPQDIPNAILVLQESFRHLNLSEED